jgi:hemolysin D
LSRRDVAEEVAQATRQEIGVNEQLEETRLKIETTASDMDVERWKLAADLRAMQTKRDALAFALAQTSIVASRTGKLEAVLAHEGDALEPGMVVGKLVPSGAPVQIVAFVPERDRAFLVAGGAARVELDQLPPSEFAMLAARITRIATDISSNAEVREILGEKTDLVEPVYRVELSLEDDGNYQRLAHYVRPGSLLTVRCTLRKRRLVALLLPFLRRWLD